MDERRAKAMEERHPEDVLNGEWSVIPGHAVTAGL